MSKLHKYSQVRNLAKYQVWITDTDPASRYFKLTQFPEILTAGKNSFLINGSDELMPNTEVLVELVDSAGQLVFSQPIPRYIDGLSRIVSIEVYDDTAPGLATITVLGQLRQDENGNIPPSKFHNSYNVKWQRSVLIDPAKPNVSPIRLYRRPIISVTEQLVPYRDVITGSIQVHNTGSITGVTTLANVSSPSTTLIPSGFIFNRDMVGATVAFTTNGTPYSGTIDSVVNTRYAKINPPFTSSATLSNTFIPTNFSIKYRVADSFITSSLTRSFADVRIDRLTTFTGDVQRAKMYAKSLDEPGDYQFLADITIDATELTTTSSVATANPITPLGDFSDTSIVSSHWEGGYVNGNSYIPTASVILATDSSQLMDSLYISTPSLATGSTSTPLFFGLRAPLQFDQNVEYSLQANYLCFKSSSGFEGKLQVYLYGSAFPSSSLSPYGTLVREISVASASTRSYVLDDTINFVSTNSGSAYLRFVVTGGQWFVSDVKLVYANTFGYNPDSVRILLPVQGRRFERLKFKSELFDYNSNRLPVDIESDPVLFNGGNMVIKGGDNILQGSLNIQGSTSAGPMGSAITVMTGSGFYADGQGNFRVGSDVSGSDFIQLTPGNGLIIRTTSMSFSSSGFALSSLNSGNISLGNATSLYNGTGIWMTGQYSGAMRVGEDTNLPNPSYMLFESGTLTLRGRLSIQESGSSGTYTDSRQVIANYIAFGPFGFYMVNL